MKFGKVLRNTAMASAVAILAFGGAAAYAGNGGVVPGNVVVDGVFQAHVGASVVRTTKIVENDPVSFGNIDPRVAGTIIMDTAGVRSVGSGGILPLSGQYTGNPDSYGAARAGSYSVTLGDGSSDLYLTFFNGTGAPGNAGSTPVVQGNPITLTPPAGGVGTTGVLTVYNLTVGGASVTPVLAGDHDIYAGDATYRVGLTGGAADFTVGGTIESTTGTYADGPYRGVFDIMVHY